jgi:hypothetical protein
VKVLPNLFVIGAAKSGTTSLHRYLDAHPEISMTAQKETMIFARPDWRERIADFAELVDAGSPVRGEATTSYSAYPWQPEIPDRVVEAVPDARVLYVVRDPIDRALSHYAQNVWDGFRVRPFEKLVDDPEDPMNMPVWCSRYATQLGRWIERLGPERALVIDGSELEREPGVSLKRAFEFLGVDPFFVSDGWRERHNQRRDHRRPTRFGGRLGSVAEVWPLRNVLTRPVPVPQLTDVQRARLGSVLRPEANRLREMTGLAFDHWSV